MPEIEGMPAKPSGARTSRLDQIVNAVLYEGYILYPYRPSSKKNRQRFTFGRVYPQAYSVAQSGIEPFVMQTECLARCTSDAPMFRVSVRFLQPMAREVGALGTTGKTKAGDFQVIPELRVDGQLYQTWQEAVEREVKPFPLILNGESPSRLNFPFEFSGSENRELICDHTGRVVGKLRRRQEEIEGALEIAVKPVENELFKITVRILNQSPLPPEELHSPDAVLMRTFASAHTILSLEGGEFISLTDPSPECRQATTACHNLGTWPVLVGDEQKGERDTMLSSPIILPDYPQVAPESSGDLFDGTEIDEILTLRIKTMTDDEKAEMRMVDEHARRLLERTESASNPDLLKLHGTMREPISFDDHIFGNSKKLTGVPLGDVVLKPGDLVRICPKGRADIMDLALAGKTAIIEAIEEDAEAHIHLALVLENDPGKDLGMLRQPGHRFFYALDEIEPLRGET